jgi:hypothetical protein
MEDTFCPLDIAREWLIECFGDQADEIEEASDREIKAEVERHYDGGWSAFVAQAQADHDAPRPVMTPEGWQFITVNAE